MVENLSVNSNDISWDSNNKNILIKVDNAFFASEDKKNEYIYIESGKNFIKDRVCYYDFNGNLDFLYDLKSGVIEWTYNDEKRKLVLNNLKEVGYYPKKNRILVLFSDEAPKAQGYNLSGEYLYHIDAPTGYGMVYFGESDDSLLVVCDGDKQNEDKFGRFRVNFKIDIINGNLTKGNLAY